MKPTKPPGRRARKPLASAAALGEPYYTKGGWNGESEWGAEGGGEEWWGEGGDDGAMWGDSSWEGAPSSRRRRHEARPEAPPAVAMRGHLRRAKARRREREKRRVEREPPRSSEEHGAVRMPQAGEVASRQVWGARRRGRAADEAEAPPLVRLDEGRGRRRSEPSS